MSSPSEQISPGLFVVRPAAAGTPGDALSRLAGKASVEPLEGRTPGWIVRLNKPPRSAREGWRSLHRLLGADYVVLPAMVDDSGRLRFPTGLLSLRFGDEADDSALHGIAEAYGLELVGRPRFTRQQALFRPAGGSEVFLPDVSGRIERDRKVEAVWFDAESAFTRA
ncbi:MAG: hypothetical protein ACOY82_05450 [Pseudomonadota bacterium]